MEIINYIFLPEKLLLQYILNIKLYLYTIKNHLKKLKIKRLKIEKS